MAVLATESDGSLVTFPTSDPETERSSHAGTALDRVRAELDALDERAVETHRVDLTTAALVVLGAAPRARHLRSELVAIFGERAVRPLDRMELVVFAALQAEAEYVAFEGEPRQASLAERVTRHRGVLEKEVWALVARGLVPAGALDRLTRGCGHRNVGLDVLQLVGLLRHRWDAIEGKTGVTVADLDEAEALVDALAREAGARARIRRSAPAQTRARAVHLLASSYAEVRRLVGFLRFHEGDADRIAPPLFSQNGARKRRAKGAGEKLTERDATGSEPGG